VARRGDPLLQQARSDTRFRYSGSLSGLLSARRTAHHQYQRDVQTAEDSARALKQGAKQSIGQLKAIFEDADATRTRAAQQIDAASNIAAMPHNALTAALSAERSAAGERNVDARTSAQVEAVNRGSDATAGLVFQKRNALQGYRETRSDLMAKTRDVHREAGAFEQSRLGDLQSAQADAQRQAQKDTQAQSNSDRTYNLQVAKQLGLNPVTGEKLPASARRTPAQELQVKKDTSAATEEIKRARVWINQLRTKGGDDKTIVQLLTQGGSLPTTIEYSGANSKGEKVKKVRTKDISVPAFSPDFVRAALELEDLNHVSKQTLHLLRATHNVRVPKEWLPPTSGQFGPH
jgi:hypothetical protein